MARVHERKARKDYPAQGIKKGDTYYTWKTRVTVGKSYHGQIHRSLTRPVSTSSSDFQRAMDQIAKDFQGADSPDSLREIAGAIRELGEECREKYENMPEGLQQGDTGQMLDERATGCEEWADAVEETADALETKLDEIQAEEDDPERVAINEAWDHYDTECEDADEGEEVPEPEGEDTRDHDYEEDRNEAISEAVAEAEGACPI